MSETVILDSRDPAAEVAPDHVIVVTCLDCRFSGDGLVGSPAAGSLRAGWATHLARYPAHIIDAFAYRLETEQ